MAKVDQCDCCGSTEKVGRVVMDATGVHPPAHRPRQDVRAQVGPDLCESCRVSLAFKWGELKKSLRLATERPEEPTP